MKRIEISPEELQQAVVGAEYTALARAELGVDQLSTWDSLLARDARLLVPVDVQALVVGPGTPVEAVPTETVVAPESATLVPPEPFGAPAPRAAGVHLHWAMPDGLTRGDAGAIGADRRTLPAGNPTGLPSLPDRWVVTRLVHGARDLRCWVLEADRGDRHDLAGWTDPGQPPADTLTGSSGRRYIPRGALTAVAGGDPAWAATYDAVVDRFAFHDDLTDLPSPKPMLSYVVAGWWSDPALDPLRDCDSAGAYEDRTRRLGWLGPPPQGLPESTVERSGQREKRAGMALHSPAVAKTGRAAVGGGEVGTAYPLLVEISEDARLAVTPAMPRLTLLHGSAFGVQSAATVDLAPDPAAIEVAIGPTGYAALSALLADGTDAERLSSERVLAAFASGLLSTIDGPSGLAAVDEDRHASAFTAMATGARARPDRIAEGDLLPSDRSVPTGKSKGKRKALLVSQGEYQVIAAANEQRRPATTAAKPRTFRDVPVPAPRAFTPADLAFVLRGAARSQRHGGDGRYTRDGRLACRLPNQVVSGLRGLLDGGRLPPGLTTVRSGAVPPEVDLLLREAVLTDPYRWQEIAEWATADTGLPAEAVAGRMRAETALRNTPPTSRKLQPELDDEATDPLRRASLYDGYDVSLVGVTRWAQPWIPLWCEWEVEVRVDDRLDRWELGPVDFTAESLNDLPSARTIRGRTLLASAATKAFGRRIRQWLSEEDARDAAGIGQAGEEREAELAAAATAAEGLDVLAGSFHGIRETLLGLDPCDASRAVIDPSGTPLSKPLARDLPLLLAGGEATVTRLRIVDAFGRWRDVPADRLAAAEVAATLAHPSGGTALTLRPRIQRPSRIVCRFVDPRAADDAPDVEARVDQQHADQAVSPVAGWLLPDHVDEALEFFDASGAPLGQLMHDELTGAVVWEGAPGRPGPAGGPPDPGADPGARHVTRLVAGLVAADVAARTGGQPPDESALSALLRAIDTTLWTVDPLGSIGTGAVAGLVGRPIAVVRAVLRLDVADDVDALSYPDDEARPARVRAYGDLAARAFAIRLGELTRTDDGLLAYAVDDDYSTLRVVAPEIRDQARQGGRRRGQLGVYGRGSQDLPEGRLIDHPYVGGPTGVALHPGQTVRLTLLLHPGGKVHVTSGVFPRKSLALARDWFTDALAKLSPSVRVGPVLVDPDAVRLPMVTGLGDKQAFTRRDTPQSWRDDPIVAATQAAYLPELPSTLQEGWIRVLQIEEEES